MSYRTKKGWAEIVDGKSPEEVAHFLTSDLTGYNTSSSWRSDDEKSIAALILALVEGVQSCPSPRS